MCERLRLCFCPISNITWNTTGTGLYGDTLLPTSCTATATYTAAGSRQVATGYVTTANYTGEITAEGVQSIRCTVTYLGAPIPEPEPELVQEAGPSKVTPYDVAQWSVQNGCRCEGNGSYHSLIPNGGEHYGLTVAKIGKDSKKLVEALESGKLVIAIMSPGHFTTTGHFIVLRASLRRAMCWWPTPPA